MSSFEGLKFVPYLQTANKELVGINETIAADQYTKSVGFAFVDQKPASVDTPQPDYSLTSGRIRRINIIVTGGAVLKSAGDLFIFNADPAISAADTSLAADGAEHKTAIAKVVVTAADYNADANGGLASLDVDIAFPELSNIYFAFRLASGETTINDLAGDDEQVEMNFVYSKEH